MQPRERVLAAIVAGLLVVLVGYWLLTSALPVFSSRTERIALLQAEIDGKLARVARARPLTAELEALRARSLPADRELARTLYQNWLVALADGARLSEVSVEASRGAQRGKAFERLSFTVRAKGTLPQTLDFLRRFYAAGHLHQIRDLALKPIDASGRLDVQIVIEGLIVAGTQRTDALSDVPGPRAADTAAVDAAVKQIVERNFFAEYRPPPPPAPPPAPPAPTPPPPPEFDAAKFAFLTAVITVGGEPEAWIHLRTTGELRKLRAGDELRVGSVTARVVAISGTNVELETDGRRVVLALGKSVRSAIPSLAELFF